jgi:hypothetical protein
MGGLGEAAIAQDPATWKPMEAALPAKTEFAVIQAALKEVSAKEIPVHRGEQHIKSTCG